jgi:membrane-associated phospholipid phosphatase
LFIPTLAFLLFLNLDTYLSFALSHKAKQYIVILVFFNTAIVPMLTMLLLKKTGKISTLSLHDKRERLVPLFVGAACYFLTYNLLLKLHLHPFIAFYLATCTILALLTMSVTWFWKISAHMVSMGALTGALVVFTPWLQVDTSNWIIASFVLAGLLGSARIVLKGHGLLQVLAGFVVGFATTLLLFVLHVW